MKNINVIIPSGGLGTRFNNTEFTELKPFIKFFDKTMFEHIIESLNSKKYNVNYHIIIQEKFKNLYIEDIKRIEKNYNANFHYINLLTEGTTSTALFLYDLINNDDFTLLMNCDQLIDVTLDEYIDKHIDMNSDGSLLVFDEGGVSKKWSFVDEKNNVVYRVVAKDNISSSAVCGWYAWSKGSDFVKYGIQQIINLDKVNGEYYLCPVFNYAIKDNKKITCIKIKKEQMHGLGTPEDLREYIKLKKQ